jgi:hypothetical protein
MATLRYPDIGLSMVGGVLFLRLINPAIIFPKKFGAIDGEVNADGQRALLVASKVLQRLANQQLFEEDLEPAMLFANRFIKSHLPRWKSFFHKFITGQDLLSASTAIKLDLSPEDLIYEANQDIKHELICAPTKSKQKEMFHRLFQLEKQTTDWEAEANEGAMTKYKKFPGSSIVVAATEVVLPGSAEDFVKVLRQISGGPLSLELAIGRDKGFEHQIMYDFNEHLQIVRTIHKAHPLLNARDFITLNHLQSIPEDNFAISCCASIEKEGYPPVKGCVRGDILHGCIFRGNNNGTTTISILLHLDSKGLSKVTPSYLLKKGILKTHTDLIQLLRDSVSTKSA